MSCFRLARGGFHDIVELCENTYRTRLYDGVFWTHRAVTRTAAPKESNMNKDQVEGKLQDIGGKLQEEAGKLVGNQEQQVKGLKNQVEGKTQEKYGDAKDALRDATN
ncbi:MAG: CsbD family protein [Massilia sp.]|nr:CsbD family protein [Massilia sp.]